MCGGYPYTGKPRKSAPRKSLIFSGLQTIGRKFDFSLDTAKGPWLTTHMTNTARRNLPATKQALTALGGTEFNEIRNAFYTATDGIGSLLRELDNVASQHPRLAELHSMIAKMDKALTDSAMGAVL